MSALPTYFGTAAYFETTTIQFVRGGSDGWAVALDGDDDDGERGATFVCVRLCKCARPRWVSRVGRRRSIDNHPLRRTTLFSRAFTSVGNRFPAAVVLRPRHHPHTPSLPGTVCSLETLETFTNAVAPRRFDHYIINSGYTLCLFDVYCSLATRT